MAKRNRRSSKGLGLEGMRPKSVVEDVSLAEATRTRYLNYAPERDHVAGLARRSRRPQAGAAADLVRDVARPARHRRRPLHEVRGGRRRGDEELPPARRPVDLRRPGPDGPAVQPSPSSGRGLRQLRLDRRRPARRHAVHRVPPDADRPGAAERAARPDGRFPAQLRLDDRGAESSCPRSSRTCWSTARRGSPSGWRRTSRRTT